MGLRTQSIPELGQQDKMAAEDARSNSPPFGTAFCKRHLSVTHSDRTAGDSCTSPRIHDEEWYQKTQQLFLAIRNARLAESDLPNVKLTSSSCGPSSSPPADKTDKRKEGVKLSVNRMTSHHSSSEEEWYTEIQQTMALVTNRSMEADDQLLTNPPPTRVNTVGETDFCRQTVLGAIHQLSLNRDSKRVNEPKEASIELKKNVALKVVAEPSSNPTNSPSLTALNDYSPVNPVKTRSKRSHKNCVIMYMIVYSFTGELFSFSFSLSLSLALSLTFNLC
jgi:hypothetical protein